MQNVELEGIGIELCRRLMARDYQHIAEWLGYAISFGRATKDAIKEDFEQSLHESGGALELSEFKVTVKTFDGSIAGLSNLIECRFFFPDSESEVLAEIIQNDSGFYLEQISCVKS